MFLEIQDPHWRSTASEAHGISGRCCAGRHHERPRGILDVTCRVPGTGHRRNEEARCKCPQMSVHMRQQLNVASNWFIQKCHTLLALLHSLLPSLNSTVQTNSVLRPSSSQHKLMLTSVSKQLSGKTNWYMSVYNTCQASHAESTVGSVGKVDLWIKLLTLIILLLCWLK